MSSRNRKRSARKSGARRLTRPPRRQGPPRSLIRQTGVQWVRLGGWREQPTDGSGVCAGVLVSDPTLINNGTIHPEYAAWSSLFGEIKVHSIVATFFPRFAESKSTSTDGTPMAIAGSTNVTSAPTTIDVVLDNASSRAWNFLNDASSQGFRFEFKYDSLLWGPSGSPGGVTSTGTPGGIGFFGEGYAASTFGIFIRYSVVYQMRNRI